MLMLVRNRSLLVLPVLLGSATLASAQKFANAGFESPNVPQGSFLSRPPAATATWEGDRSWGIADGSGSWGTGAHSGSQYAYIQSTNEFGGAGSLYQTLTGLTVGNAYSVTFWMARRNGNVGANDSNAISVFAGSVQILAPTATGPAWTEFTTAAFTATSTSMRITFQGKAPSDFEDVGSLIDDVSLSPVPAPGSVAAYGFGALAMLRRRKRA